MAYKVPVKLNSFMPVAFILATFYIPHHIVAFLRCKLVGGRSTAVVKLMASFS